MPTLTEINAFVNAVEVSIFFRFLLLGLGIAIGFLLLWIDKVWLYKEYAEDIHLTPGQYTPRLITRSLFFMLSFIPLAIFVVTSSGSAVGNGVVLGIGAGLSLEMLKFRLQPDVFHDYFLSQLKRQLSQKEINQMVVAFILFVALLVFFSLV